MILLLKTAPDGHGLPAGAIPMLRQPAPGEPTPAQVEAGNYPKRRVTWNGLAIRIENEAGTIRYGKGWQTRMLYPYGYIERSESADGDEVDVYLGPALDYAPTVFVVVQMRYGRWDEVDENKCMLGFMSEDDARTAYLKHYDDPRFLGSIIEMPVDEFVRKAKDTRERPGLIKANVAAYTRADGTQVAEHDRHTRYAQLFKPSLGIKREDMPQVPSGVKQKFLEELRAAGISVEAKTVKPATLKPTQGTYNTENMDYLTQQVRSGDYDSKSPILVSQDDRVLDGHHRWAVAHLEGQDQPVVKIGLPIDKLLVATKKFCAENGVESRGTTGGATIAKALGGDLVLFLKSRVGPYLRDGKLVNLSGYQGRAARAQPAPGQLQLFTAPARPARPNPYKDKDPVLDTSDLFTGKTKREEPPAAAAEAAPPPPKPPHPLERSAASLQRMRDAIAAGGDKSGFYQAVIPDHEREHNRLAAAFDAFNKHGDGTELSDKDGKRHAILLPDASNPGKYRYQMFDERGFSAHSTHDTPEQAVADAASNGFHVHNPGILDKLAGTEEWAHGMAINAVMQSHNSGQIDWRTAMDKIAALHDEREAKKAGTVPAAPPAPAAAPDPTESHPSKPTRSLLNLVPEDRRAEWLDLHKRQHEMHHYDLGQIREELEKHRTPMHRALTKLRESEALAKEARKGGDLPGTDDRIRLADNAVAQNSIEFQRHSKEVERLKNMHQTVYERVAKLGREKNAIASETGSMDIDWASMKQRAPEDQAKHEKTMLAAYRAHYKAKDAEARAAKKAAKAGTMAKAWDWLGTEPVLGQRSILFLAAAALATA